MSTAEDGIPDRAFVTAIARLIESPEFEGLVPWWRRLCVEQAVDRICGPAPSAYVGDLLADVATMERIAFALKALVASKGELIDGRSKRHAGPAGSGKRGTQRLR